MDASCSTSSDIVIIHGNSHPELANLVAEYVFLNYLNKQHIVM